MAKNEKKAKKKSDGSKQFIKNLVFTTIILTMIAAGMSSVGLKSVAVLIIVLLTPGLVVMLIDWRKGRHASKTIFIFNLAGLFPQLLMILTSGSPNNIAINQIQDMPQPALVPWMAAAFGWSVVYMFPKIIQLFLEVKSEYTINKLQVQQDELLEEWGEEIKKFIPKELAQKLNAAKSVK
jgi:hypothetical protein